MLADFWNSLPDGVKQPTVLAIPFFLALITLEALASWLLEEKEPESEASKKLPSGESQHAIGSYFRKDAVTSISMGLVSLLFSGLLKLVFFGAYIALYAISPWQIPANSWWGWVVAIVVVDFVYYWAHRISHRVRLVWATHQVHHSSEYFNFSTALRQKWNGSLHYLLWLGLAFLGFHPAMIFTAYGVNLVFQFVVHTERVHKMWRPVEFIMNTPSHHRVHHGSDALYLDRNYAGIFIIWDRMFGSFQEEINRPLYGLTKPVNTYNMVKLQTHEYVAIARDVKQAGTLREKLGYVFGPPGWTPEEGAPVHVGTIKVTPEMRKQASWKKEDVDVVA